MPKGSSSPSSPSSPSCRPCSPAAAPPAPPVTKPVAVDAGVVRLLVGGDSRDDYAHVLPWAFREAKARGASAFIFLGDMELTPSFDAHFRRELGELGDVPFYPGARQPRGEGARLLRSRPRGGRADLPRALPRHEPHAGEELAARQSRLLGEPSRSRPFRRARQREPEGLRRGPARVARAGPGARARATRTYATSSSACTSRSRTTASRITAWTKTAREPKRTRTRRSRCSSTRASSSSSRATCTGLARFTQGGHPRLHHRRPRRAARRARGRTNAFHHFLVLDVADDAVIRGRGALRRARRASRPRASPTTTERGGVALSSVRALVTGPLRAKA